MQLQWTDRQEAIRAEYLDFGRSVHAAGPASGLRAFNRQAWDCLKEAGLWTMVLPREFGGGQNWWDFTAALDGLSSSLRAPGLLLSIIAQAGMVRALDLLGTRGQKDVYFARILRGELSATAIADFDTGTDVRATSTILTPGPNETFVLDGSKYNIAHAQLAGFIMVVCKLDGHARDGISLVLVDSDAEGLRIGPEDRKLGNSDLPTGWLSFKNVKLTYGDLLGIPGEGLRNLVSIVSLGRLYYGLVASRLMEPMLAEAMRFSQSRQTFGVAIGEHQYIQKKLTDMRIGMETSKWVSFAALHQLLNGEAEAAMTCSIAKIAGTQTIVESALELVRLYGSKGYHEGEVTGFLRDVLAFCSVGGTEEMHRRNIFSQMTKLDAKASGVRPEMPAQFAEMEMRKSA